MAKKGKARRFKEARELKESFDDGLFSESSKSLYEVEQDYSDYEDNNDENNDSDDPDESEKSDD